MIQGETIRYKIKTCPSNDLQQLENILNEMATKGWELYSLQESESKEGLVFNCIFMKETFFDNEEESRDVYDLLGVRSQMERILAKSNDNFHNCCQVQAKIQNLRAKISEIKTKIDSESSLKRKALNEILEEDLKELDKLKQVLIDIISPKSVEKSIGEQRICISLSHELLDLVNPDLQAPLISSLVNLRQRIVHKYGYILPKVTFDLNENLAAYQFTINFRALCFFKGFVYPQSLLFFKDDLPKNLDCIQFDDVDFFTGKDVVWCDREKAKDFWSNSKTAQDLICDILEDILIEHIDIVFNYKDVSKYIELVSKNNISLVESIIPDFLTVSELKYILISLLQEQVSIKDIVFIFEKLNDLADFCNKDELTEKLRLSLSYQITKSLKNEHDKILAIEFSQKSLNLFSENIYNQNILHMEQQDLFLIINKIKKIKQKYNNIAILVPLSIRHTIFLALSKFINNPKVISREEIVPNTQLQILDTI